MATPTTSASATPTSYPFVPFGKLAVPTPTPTPVPVPTPKLTIDPFTNTKGEAPARFTLTGTTDPLVSVTVDIAVDRINKTIQAEESGKWSFALPKALTKGKKTVTVTAVNAFGGSQAKTVPFTVAAGRGGFWWILLAIILIAIIIWYVYTKLREPPIPPYTPDMVTPFDPTAPDAHVEHEVGESNNQQSPPKDS